MRSVKKNWVSFNQKPGLISDGLSRIISGSVYRKTRDPDLGASTWVRLRRIDEESEESRSGKPDR